MAGDSTEPADSLAPEAAEATMREVYHRLWPYTCLVFTVPEGVGYTRHIGGGTLIATHSGRYVLTAAHVWRAIRGDLFLGGRPPHPPLQISRDLVVPTLFSGRGEDADGPDLAYLRLPDIDAKELSIEKAFYNLAAREVPGTDNDPYWTVLGAPAARTSYSEPRVDMKLTFVGSRRAVVWERDSFDYVDLSLDRTALSFLPGSFGGVSGSGLWRVPLTPDGTGQPYSVGEPVLAGMAFYEYLDKSDRMHTIRCHGPKSLYSRVPGRVA